MKIKMKKKDCQLVIKAKAAFGESIDEKELDRFARIYLRGFLKPRLIKKNQIEYTGPIGISLFERLKRPLTKRDFLFIIEQIVVAVQKLQINSLPLNNLLMNIQYVYINIKKNLRAEMGLNVTKGGFKTKTPFSPVKSFFVKDYNKSFMLNDTMVISEGTFKVFKGVKIFKNVADTWENLSTLDSNLSKSDWTATEVGETVESITGLGKFSKFTSIYDKFGTKGGKTISSWIEDGAKWYELLAN